MLHLHYNGVEIPNIPQLLDDMAADASIVEIEYVLPGTQRIKSFYLPKGTEVRVINAIPIQNPSPLK